MFELNQQYLNSVIIDIKIFPKTDSKPRWVNWKSKQIVNQGI